MMRAIHAILLLGALSTSFALRMPAAAPQRRSAPASSTPQPIGEGAKAPSDVTRRNALIAAGACTCGACAWLASELLGGSEKVASLQEIDADKLDALRNLVDAYPTVLGLSVEKNLKPKLHALRTELKPSELRDRGKHPLARDGAAAAVLQCPALLGYSLDGRLRPRLRRIRQAGLPLADIATLAQCPEAQFEKRLQGRLARA